MSRRPRAAWAIMALQAQPGNRGGTKTKQLFGKGAALAGSPFIGIPASHLLGAAAKALGVAQTAEPGIISGSAVIQIDVTAYLGTSVALDLRGYLIPVSAGVFILMTLMNPYPKAP